MATADLIGLFGQDPQMIQQAMDIQRAQMTPEQRMYIMGAQGGRALGQGLGALFGVDVQDPMVKKASALRALSSEYDTTTPEGLAQFAQAASKIDPRAGMLAAQQADAIRKQQAETRAKEADIKKTESETLESVQKRNLMIGRVAMLLGSGLSESEATGIASSDSAFSKFVENKKVATPADYAVQAQALGFGAKPYLSDYSPDQVKEMEKAVFGHKAGIASAGKSTVINQQESAFAKQRGELQAKTLAETEAQAKASANAVSRLASMEKLNQGKMLTGPMAGTAIGAGQFLSSVGLLSPDAAKTLSSSEVYDKLAKDLVMQDLGGKLGAQISNADRDFIEARIPQLRNSQEARTELIAKLKEIHQKNIDYYRRMSKHANTKGNLNDFDFSSGAPDSSPTLGTKENPIKLQ